MANFSHKAKNRTKKTANEPSGPKRAHANKGPLRLSAGGPNLEKNH